MTGNKMIRIGMSLLKKACSIKINGCCSCPLKNPCNAMYFQSLDVPFEFELGDENERQ